ncbi:hypothetical protein CLIM01_10969 [Colletotrichum limetticola]|nr:hypothetical protein CLIM01_10969 [Colletotrichum limetticola]
MPQSCELSNTINDMDIEPENPTTYGWAFGAYERVGPDTGALKLSGASFDVKTSPSHMENTYVDHLSWLLQVDHIYGIP